MTDLRSTILVEHDSDLYRETVKLRLRILREPLGLRFTLDEMATECSDLHIAMLVTGALAGCLVLHPLTGGVIKMRQVAVDSIFQGQGIGQAMVEYAEIVAIERGFTRMELSARETSVGFYLKLGYETLGEPYEEVTLPHRKMAKPLI